MEAFKGIKVEITSGGKTLPLYDDPDAAELEDCNIKQYYVEALTDKTFAVSVIISSELDAKASDGVRVQMLTDDNSCAWGKFIPKSLWTGSRNRYTHEFTGVTQYCEKSGQWRRYDYSFGKLNIQDQTGPKITPASIRNLGRIRIEVYLAYKVRRRAPRHYPESGTVKDVKEVSEKTLKGKAITNSIGLKQGSTVKPPEPSYYDIVPMLGPDGQSEKVNILYRSKQYLQSLGCIPRTPSPEPEIAQHGRHSGGVTSNEIKEPTAVKREQTIQALRAQLAILESEHIVKPEISSRAGIVKRERGEDGTSSTSKRARKSEQIETVDLTSD